MKQNKIYRFNPFRIINVFVNYMMIDRLLLLMRFDPFYKNEIISFFLL